MAETPTSVHPVRLTLLNLSVMRLAAERSDRKWDFVSINGRHTGPRDRMMRRLVAAGLFEPWRPGGYRISDAGLKELEARTGYKRRKPRRHRRELER